MTDCKIAKNVVVLIRREKVYKAHKLFQGKKVQFDKLSFFPDGALGCYYGSQFEVHRQQLVLVQENETQGEGGGSECGHDNREIVDDGSAQALKEGAILKLRAEGRGKEVVGTVVEHSNSFKIKTKFSQEKYINKKKKKHAPVITILKPSTRTLCEMYYSRGPSKICHMRPDTVAQILTYSNVHPHSNMVVMETTQGLLLTAMLERMGGLGNLVQVFFGDFPVKLAVENSSHLSQLDKSPLLEYPLHRIGSRFPPVLQSSVLSRMRCGAEGSSGATVPLEGPVEETDHHRGTEETAGPAGSQTSSPDSGTDRDSEGELAPQPPKKAKLSGSTEGLSLSEERACDRTSDGVAPAGNREERERRRQEREERYATAEKLLRQKRMDGLVLACRFHPEPLLTALLGLLAPSRPVVVYCHLLEPLIDCYKTLKQKEDVVFDVEISETWTRYYQVG
jgi:tRNA (adenine-N(1)-)-methyltransferase non-catalytic subunit